METASFTFVTLNLTFAAIFMAAARLLLGRRGSPILWAYVLVTLLFVYLLPVQDYSLSVGIDVLLLSHLLLLAFLIAVLLIAHKHAGTLGELIAAADAVRAGAIAAIIVGWLSWRLYLIYAYGPAALMFSRAQVVHSSGQVEFSTLEMALSSMTTLALLGGIAVVVVRIAGGERLSRPLVMAVALMVALIVVTNESPIGSRRLLMVLGALWLCVAWMRSRMAATAWIYRHIERVTLTVVIVAALASYYQNIRNNDMTEILASREPVDFVAAVVKFATSFPSERDSSDVEYLRSGPLDFFAKVVDVSVGDGRTSRGEATMFSLALLVPKALYLGEKPVGDVDDVLFRQLEIYPSRPFLTIDYSMSLAAIGVADYGPLGVIPAAILLAVCFVVTGRTLGVFRRYPLALVLIFGVALILIGSPEAGLTAILAAIRDASSAIFLVVVGQELSRGVFQGVKGALRTQAQSARLKQTVKGLQ